MNTILITLSLIIAFSCSNKSNIEKDISKLISAPITLPTKTQISINGKDTVINNFFDSDIKMVVYADSIGCTSCRIHKMYLWDSFIEHAKQYNGRLKFYFIYAPSQKDYKQIKFALKTNIFDYPIIIDETGMFEKLNPHLPKNKAMHAFLLDENNKVILVGNPLYNKEIEKLFYKKTQERLAK